MLQSLTQGLVAFTLLQSGDAILSVPGPVSTANLESLGADSFRVSFGPPASDGGSDITSYLVSTETDSKEIYILTKVLIVFFDSLG